MDQSQHTSSTSLHSLNGPLADSEIWQARQKQKEQARIVKFITTFIIRLIYVVCLIFISNGYVDRNGNIYKENLSQAFALDESFIKVQSCYTIATLIKRL